jgi:hypothetical protein
MRGQNLISFPAKWNFAGSITSETAALAVTGRGVATVDALAAAKTVKLTPPLPGPYAMLLRFRADGAADLDSILQMYNARGAKDHYNRNAQLTIVTGTQDTDTSTIHFIDTITPASEDVLFEGTESNLTNMIGTYYMRTLGNDRFIIIASDLDSTTVYVDVCWIYEQKNWA